MLDTLLIKRSSNFIGGFTLDRFIQAAPLVIQRRYKWIEFGRMGLLGKEEEEKKKGCPLGSWSGKFLDSLLRSEGKSDKLKRSDRAWGAIALPQWDGNSTCYHRSLSLAFQIISVPWNIKYYGIRNIYIFDKYIFYFFILINSTLIPSDILFSNNFPDNSWFTPRTNDLHSKLLLIATQSCVSLDRRFRSSTVDELIEINRIPPIGRWL